MKLKRLLSLMLIMLFFVGQLTVSAAETLIPPTENSADTYKWLYANAFKGMSQSDMIVDKWDNVYFYNFLNQQVTYDNHTLSYDGSSIYVIKLNSGNEYQWLRKISIPNVVLNARSMDVDADGNMYFGGDFSGTFSLGDSEIVYTSGENAGQAYFIMKTDQNGDILWFKSGYGVLGSISKVKYTNGRVAFTGKIKAGAQLNVFGDYEFYETNTSIVGAIDSQSGTRLFLYSLDNAKMSNVDFMTFESTANTIAADSQGKVYVAGVYTGSQLTVHGPSNNTQTFQSLSNIETNASNFLMKINEFGGIDWVQHVRNVNSVLTPTIALNGSSTIALLGTITADFFAINGQVLNNSEWNAGKQYIAMYDNNGVFINHILMNNEVLEISPSQNGSFAVAGVLKSAGQSFGMENLSNADSNQENLFVGFIDNTLNGISGQSVISNGYYRPTCMRTGTDGKVRLLGDISNYNLPENEVATYSFGEYVVSNSANNNLLYSVLDPKQLVKAQIFSHGIDCGRFALNVNPTIKSRVEWYVNDVLKGTDFSLMGFDQQGGYKFTKGINYIKVVATDSTDATNFAIARDTIEVYEPVVNINTQINPQTGVVDYKVTVSNFARQYSVSIDRGNYDYAQELTGSYTYAPGEHSIKVILNEPSNHNCFFRYEKTFIVPTPETIQECNRGVIKGRVESTLAAFMAGEVRVDLFSVVNGSQHVYLKSDTIDAAGEFNIGGLSEGQYILRANIIDPTKYPQLLVTYFNDIMNQVVYWQEATPIVLTCNLWADVNLTFAALNEALNGTGSISGVISYSTGSSGAPGAKSSIKASSQIADALMSNVPVILRKKSNQEIVARTVTDENGVYVFENLIEDEYEILVEIPGTEMVTTYDVTIDESVENVENRNFVVTNSGINTTTQLAVVATATDHGTITPVGTTMLNPGENMSYSITPSVGYAIQDVLVNGVSVGVVTSYNFTNINTNQSIHAVFNSITGLDNNDLNKLIVYPAVFDNNIIVSGLNAGSEIRILNQLGVAVKVVRNLQADNMLQIETASLSAGVYFIEIFNAEQRIKTLKAIKK